jgi:hypothetical protein
VQGSLGRPSLLPIVDVDVASKLGSCGWPRSAFRLPLPVSLLGRVVIRIEIGLQDATLDFLAERSTSGFAPTIIRCSIFIKHFSCCSMSSAMVIPYSASSRQSGRLSALLPPTWKVL